MPERYKWLHFCIISAKFNAKPSFLSTVKSIGTYIMTYTYVSYLLRSAVVMSTVFKDVFSRS